MSKPMIDYGEKIIKAMKDGEWYTTSDIAKLLNIHYYQAKRELDKLKESDKVEMDEKKAGTYWRLVGEAVLQIEFKNKGISRDCASGDDIQKMDIELVQDIRCIFWKKGKCNSDCTKGLKCDAKKYKNIPKKCPYSKVELKKLHNEMMDKQPSIKLESV